MYGRPQPVGLFALPPQVSFVALTGTGCSSETFDYLHCIFSDRATLYNQSPPGTLMKPLHRLVCMQRNNSCVCLQGHTLSLKGELSADTAVGDRQDTQRGGGRTSLCMKVVPLSRCDGKGISHSCRRNAACRLG